MAKIYNSLINEKLMKQLTIFLPICLLFFACTSPKQEKKTTKDQATEIDLPAPDPNRIAVLFDTDANNELDDQHALAYLFFNEEVFDIRGITVNSTKYGGGIEGQYAEAKRVMQLCDVWGKYPLLNGAEADYNSIREHIGQTDFDGSEAVDYIIEEARKYKDHELVLLPVGKLTNIALALEKAPDIKSKVRIVWLGSNYPEPGEYNQVNDTASLSYILRQDVPFEMVTVRYGKPSGSDAVRATPDEIKQNMQGAGPKVAPVEGRHGGSFSHFGDYAFDLFSNIDLHGDPPSRALFDMVAVAIVKDPSWGQTTTIPAPKLIDNNWIEQPKNDRKIIIWENFNTEAIKGDFYSTMNSKNQE